MTAIDGKCPRCRDEHPIFRCPYVKAFEFEYGWDGSSPQVIKRIEFLTPADYGRPTATPKPEEMDNYPKLGQKA